MTTRCTLLWRLALSASLLFSGIAHAHDDAYLDTLKAPHGGQLRMAGAHHLELVLVKNSPTAKDNVILVYLTDHAGTPVSTQGVKASVTILAGKRKISSALQPDGDNRLKGQASYASTPDLKAVVSVTLPGQETQQARFTPLAPRPDAHANHTH